MNQQRSCIIGMLAETPLHAGVGQAADVVDLPVSREAVSRLPQVPDTGLKGALREFARGTDLNARHENDGGKDRTAEPGGAGRNDGPRIRRLFGDAGADGAGRFFPTTARLALLPVRRLDGPYAWATTPYIAERLSRDRERIIRASRLPVIEQPRPGRLRASASFSQLTSVFLEEFPFEIDELNDDDRQFAAALGELIADERARARLEQQLVILRDDEFVWYAENALPVTARNVLSDVKTSENIWYEESLPVDAVLYFGLIERSHREDDFDVLVDTLRARRYLRVGGNETVGQGWARLAVPEALSE